VRKAISRLLKAAGFQVGLYSSAQEFLESYDRGAPGCLLLDMAMPGLNGLDLQKELAHRGSQIPIIFLTGKADVPSSVEAMKLGAHDFLCKPADEKPLLSAVRGALERDRQQRQERRSLEELREQIASLTARELEVLTHVITGKLNKQIAGDLGTVEKTVKVHRGRVMHKLNVASVAELVRAAQRAGIEPAIERQK